MAATPTTGPRPAIAAEAFLRALADHGIDYLFANPGTDFPPIVEAFSRAKKTNAKVPMPVLVPHENLAVAMAHGAYLMNGRPQAVMVHVNVGTANTINNLTNLSRDRVPLILAAGRTPITEKGSFGSRSRPIHWAQEMFDQAGMVRELVKWDYELRNAGQVGDVVAAFDRGGDGASARADLSGAAARAFIRAGGGADRADQAARRGGTRSSRSEGHRHFGGMDRRRRTAADHYFGIAVRGGARADALWPSAAPFRSSPTTRAASACRPAIRCISATSRARCSPTPIWSSRWNPTCRGFRICNIRRPAAASSMSAKIRSSCAIRCARSRAISRSQAGVTNSLEALVEAVGSRLPMAEARIAARRTSLAERMRTRRAQLAKDSAAGERISPAYLSRAIGEAVGEDAIIFNEYPLRADHCPREKPGTLFALGPAGGLGWGLGAALGAKLAAPDKLIVATLGDGAYMFSNPTVGHWVVAKAQFADPHHHLQQQPLWRGAQLDSGDVQGRRVRRKRRPRTGRSRSGATL